jgi:hypothetical protein
VAIIVCVSDLRVLEKGKFSTKGRYSSFKGRRSNAGLVCQLGVYLLYYLCAAQKTDEYAREYFIRINLR